MKKREKSTLDLQAAVQEQLLPPISELKAIRERLRVFLESLPDMPDPEEEESDTVTELRSALGCVLLDSIDPAVRDLQAAAAYIAKRREPDER
jgi:hypothetical protein